MLGTPRTAALLRRSLAAALPPRAHRPLLLPSRWPLGQPAGTLPVARRAWYSSSPAAPQQDDADLASMTAAERSIADQLASHATLSPIASLLVRDVSGGCGSMYAIDIASPQFRGKTLLAQQRLVTKALGDRVKEWHGVQIRTSVPSE